MKEAPSFKMTVNWIRAALPPDLTPGLKWSMAGHFALAFLIFFKNEIFPDRSIPYIATLKVDLVALPDTLKKDLLTPRKTAFQEEILKALKKAETPPILPVKKPTEEDTTAPLRKEKQVASKADSHSEKKTAQQNLRALARLKSLSKFQENDSPEAPVKGNKLSPGLSVSEDAKEASEINYLNLLKDRLQDNWTLPMWIQRQNLAAQVKIYIGPRGTLQNFQFAKSSGNTQFDDAVKRTIHESQPFPFPPKELATSLQNNGVLIGFPL